VAQLGSRGDEPLERRGLEARAVVGDEEDREALAGVGVDGEVVEQRPAE
jgi:hypothetical protein